MVVISRFRVTDSKTQRVYQQDVRGAGEEAVRAVREEYPRFSKIVLLGFEIDGVKKDRNLNRA